MSELERNRGMVVYSFERRPMRRFVARWGNETTEQVVGEGQSLSGALNALRDRMGDSRLEVTELAFQAGYMVGAWDAKNGQMWPSVA